MALPDHINQPGPAGEPCSFAPTGLIDLDFELPAGAVLQTALGQEIINRGLNGACLTMAGADMSQMQFVIPAAPPDAAHVAWYSTTHTPAMPGHIKDARIIIGWQSGKPFLHSHAIFADAAQNTHMGHLLNDHCVLSAPTRVRGFGFCDARFNRTPDPETNFELFKPENIRKVSNPQGMLLRIAPNTQIDDALIACCQNAGWQQANIHGIGSLIGTHFADGRTLNSFATELLVTGGHIDLRGPAPRVDLEIAIVGMDGKFMQGRLKPGHNPTLITCELLLEKTA